MRAIRPAHERGQARMPGLHSQHSFSFGEYYDPAYMGFGPLRVINEDRVAPGAGFPSHGHSDMEIISVVRSGRMAHRDSLGHGAVIEAGEVQRMTAGTGIRHSEFNACESEPLEFLQIWVVPESTGLAPSYEQRSFADISADVLTLVGSRYGRNGSITIAQDVDMYLARLQPGGSVTHSLRAGRIAWLQVMSGSVDVNGDCLQRGDGLAISQHCDLLISSTGAGEAEGEDKIAELLLFDMAKT